MRFNNDESLKEIFDKTPILDEIIFKSINRFKAISKLMRGSDYKTADEIEKKILKFTILKFLELNINQVISDRLVCEKLLENIYNDMLNTMMHKTILA